MLATEKGIERQRKGITRIIISASMAFLALLWNNRDKEGGAGEDTHPSISFMIHVVLIY
jgi:hypothetical protein